MHVKRSIGFGMIALILGTGLLVLTPDTALADSATSLISEGLSNAGEGTYSTDLTVTVFIGNMIRTLLAATGIIFLVITVYAGILYMTAAGEPDKVKKAKSMLTSSVIGLVIIVGAYAISTYVINAIATAATTTTVTEEEG
ncbi:hypothetical protein COV05_04835 [Candidatus Uhrbacteria bacterium CG10_big_fil_rev_8_21_14_0_10_48_16]|uniref:TrbC/VIRB2 family protein n=1 Tax=Candidatus Uhrbacteria bacterium CG10_big_fil_rev_8_21_14_0_10_48_16 TaxID=1975038 RepID=A0A2M8LG18_9BACT|nr:MAG: hypothetical protein COV05_04835 [Candidatus Uhrbacteria bacterium CG10_big_fil_rev_8_21_14_0_10_48_16]